MYQNNPLMNDLLFKEIFANKHNRRQLESLLESFLNYPKGKLKDKLTVTYESQIGKTNAFEKASRADILIDFEDTTLDLEAYTYLDQESVDKSTYYVMKLSASKLLRGMEYEPFKVIQYNIVDNIHVDIGPDIINTFYLMHKDYPEIKIAEDKLQINYVRLDKVRGVGYNENELIKWLRFIAAKNYEERRAIAEGEEMFVEFNEWIDNYVNDDVTKEALAKWNEKIEENKLIKIAKEQGMKQNSREVAVKSLRLGISIEDIAEITGLSLEEIEELKEEQ